MFFRFVIIFLTSALRPPGFPFWLRSPVIPPAALWTSFSPDLDSPGTPWASLLSRPPVRSGSAVAISEEINRIGSALALSLCRQLRTVNINTPLVWSEELFLCVFVALSPDEKILKPAGCFCLLISSLRVGCLGRPQEIIPVGIFSFPGFVYFPPGNFRDLQQK